MKFHHMVDKIKPAAQSCGGAAGFLWRLFRLDDVVVSVGHWIAVYLDPDSAVFGAVGDLDGDGHGRGLFHRDVEAV